MLCIQQVWWIEVNLNCCEDPISYTYTVSHIQYAITSNQIFFLFKGHPPCSDQYPDECAAKRNLCNNPFYFDFMTKICAQTCSRCFNVTPYPSKQPFIQKIFITDFAVLSDQAVLEYINTC